jgi:hypothetical protein
MPKQPTHQRVWAWADGAGRVTAVTFAVPAASCTFFAVDISRVAHDRRRVQVGAQARKITSMDVIETLLYSCLEMCRTRMRSDKHRSSSREL